MLFLTQLGSRTLGVSALALALGLTACATGPRAVRYSTPPPELAPPGNLLATSNDPAASAPVVRQPRVIIPAPPLATSALQPAGANTLVDPYAADAPATQGASAAAAAPAPSTSATPGAAPVAIAAATPAPAAPAAYVASSVAPPLAGFTPQASPLLAAFDSSPHGQAPAPMDPMVQELQRRGPGRQGWTPDFRPSYYGSYGGYYGPSYYSGPSYYGRSYGSYYGPSYGYGGYYGPSYGYGYRPGLGLGIGLGLGFGLGRHAHGWGGGHHGHGGGFHGGGHHGHR